jgi:hypothetical protein
LPDAQGGEVRLKDLLAAAEKNALAFPVLRDAGSAAAKSFAGVDYRNCLEPAEIPTALQLFSNKQRGELHANT